MLHYQLILFDFDGTLCHTALADIHTLQKAYQSLNQLPPSIDHMQRIMGTGATAENLIAKLTPEASPTLIQHLIKAYKTLYPKEANLAELFPGTISVLKQLKTHNIATAIVSNRDLNLLHSTIKSLHLNQYFNVIIGADNKSPSKPDPALYHNTITPHFPTIPAKATLMVGDTDTDLIFAANTAIDACWASYGGGDHQTCSALQPKYTIQAISDLLDIIL